MKTLMLILAALVLAGNSFAQTLSFGGHTYVALPPMDRADSVKAATALGGYICKLETDQEFYFIDSNFVKRGTGWWWTSATAQTINRPDGSTSFYWYNDDLTALNWVLYNMHWNINQPTMPAGEGDFIVMGKFQFSYRSTKWITKFGNFTKEFASYYKFPAIVEIE